MGPLNYFISNGKTLAHKILFMNPKEIMIGLSLLLLLACNTESPLSYLDPSPAPNTAVSFAKGDISTAGVREGNLVFSPNGQSLLFVIVDSILGPQIYQRDFEGDRWSTAERVSFSNEGENYEPFFTQNGKSVYFVSNRSTGQQWNGRIWRVERQGQVWGEPEMLLIPVETDKGLWFPSVTKGGLVYFSAYLDKPENYGKSDIYSFNPTSGEISNVSPLNTEFEEWDPFIAPDESYMIFASDRTGGFGAVDHYISFKNKGTWETPLNMGSTINSQAYDVAAKVTPDQKFILFDRPLKHDQDIYWIKADLIEELKAQR